MDETGENWERLEPGAPNFYPGSQIFKELNFSHQIM